MDTSFQLKTWAIRLFGILLALVGLLLVLQLLALLLWQYTVAVETRSWPQLPVALLFADHSQLAGKPVAPFLQFVPELRWRWIQDAKNPSAMHAVATWLLDKVHIGVAPALLGALIAWAGGMVWFRRKNVLADAKQRNQDRLRRVGEYRKDEQASLSVDRGMTADQAALIEVADEAWRRDRVSVLR